MRVRSGDAVVTWFTSGNRDEDVFSEPFQFDVAREPNPHQGFGGGGPHYCFGAGLARLELQVLIEETVDRVLRWSSPDCRTACARPPQRAPRSACTTRLKANQPAG